MRYFSRIIVEIGRAIRHELLSTFGTLLTIFLATALPGIFWIASINLSRVEQNLKSRLTIDVFLNEEPSRDAIEKMRSEFLNLDGVTGVRFLSKHDALYKMRESFGQAMIQGLDENPLPASFVLNLDDSFLKPGAADSLISRISRMPNVEDIIFAGEMLYHLSRIIESVEMLGLGIAILVALSAIFIVANTVRIGISDRRRTVEIMQLVGATRNYILTPFVTLGGLLGLIGTSLATLVLWLSADYVSRNLMEVKCLDLYDTIAFMLAGLLLGMVGALIATRRFLKL